MSVANWQRGTLTAVALLVSAASATVLANPHMLIGRGLMKPLSMAADRADKAAQAGQAGRHTRVG